MAADLLHVILIEDNPDDAMVISRNLSKIQDTQIKANVIKHFLTLKETLKSINDYQYDLILTDLNLPDGEGIDLVQQLKETAREVPIIVISGEQKLDIARQSIQIGAQDYVLKSQLNELILLRSISYTMDRFELQKQIEEREVLLQQLNEDLDAELEKRNHELYESEERFQLAARGTGDGIWDWHFIKGDYYYSPRWKEMLGYNDHELNNDYLAFQSLIHPDDHGLFLLNFCDYLESELESKYKFEYRMRKQNGQYLWMESHAIKMTDDHGQIIRMTGSQSDISERKKILNDLKKAYDELTNTHSMIIQNEKMASIGLLAAGVAHEINNPLSYLSTNLNSFQYYAKKIHAVVKNIIELTEIPDQQNESIEAIKNILENDDILFVVDDIIQLIIESSEGMDRVKNIVRDLTGFARKDNKEFHYADINQGIKSTLNIAWSEVKYKADVDLNFKEIPLVECSIQKMNQVFMNLIINASHAIEKFGKIIITTSNDKETVLIAIADNGKGMSKEIIDNIFEPFYTTKAIGKGTGLGLSIAANIIEKHHGHIDVKSKEGEGTTFTIRLPIHQITTDK